MPAQQPITRLPKKYQDLILQRAASKEPTEKEQPTSPPPAEPQRDEATLRLAGAPPAMQEPKKYGLILRDKTPKPAPKEAEKPAVQAEPKPEAVKQPAQPDTRSLEEIAADELLKEARGEVAKEEEKGPALEIPLILRYRNPDLEDIRDETQKYAPLPLPLISRSLCLRSFLVPRPPSSSPLCAHPTFSQVPPGRGHPA